MCSNSQRKSAAAAAAAAAAGLGNITLQITSREVIYILFWHMKILQASRVSRAAEETIP